MCLDLQKSIVFGECVAMNVVLKRTFELARYARTENVQYYTIKMMRESSESEHHRGIHRHHALGLVHKAVDNHVYPLYLRVHLHLSNNDVSFL